MSKIAVIIPVYNAEKHLRRCIDSVCRQSEECICVLVDDGSKDKSPLICDEYAQQCDRIHVIHQKNAGSVEARRRGVLSPWAQQCNYITFLDADDTLEEDAIETLHSTAKMHSADCVCGQTRKLWRNIKFVSQYKPKCFCIDKPVCYEHTKIVQELYISCFGVSNYPVSLCGKIYRTELITKIIDTPPIVHYMGDDLSVTIRVLLETHRLVIVPNYIYNYRLGGNTSRFMPTMLEDFLSLYRLKQTLIKNVSMPQDAKYLSNVELLNCMMSWLEMFAEFRGYGDNLIEEIKRVVELPEIVSAAENINMRSNVQNMIADHVVCRNATAVCTMIIKRMKNKRIKKLAKSILYKLG